jgi:hypothetical protein
MGAFRALAGEAVAGQVRPVFQMGIEEVPRDATAEQLALSNRVRGTVLFYLSNWFAELTLAAWGVLPNLGGYLRFARSDL